MKIYINDIETEVTDGANVTEIFTQLDESAAGVAVAVNGTLVKRQAWESLTLNDGDRMLIIKAAYGG